ncbi:hypothetical protein PLEOSDRAFT_153506 [Pleurotus ostreatus PC15]|uniref:Uncharacterized protein n=1 Tax=Pleurotus ostreatus (strain PC15) TaxID=1137138 RepID=A0A067P8W7_PLEO1|nr:hypothetical protein PLEOSDRAFT_153506 [Pleurotus ostreatus PC15]
MTQPIPSSSSRKRALSDAPAQNDSRPKKKRVDGGADAATMHSSTASSRDKKKRRKKKRRLSITAHGEEASVVAETAQSSTSRTSPAAAHASSESTPDPGRYANSRRTFIHGRRQLPLSAKVKGKRKAALGSTSQPPQLVTTDTTVEEEEKAKDATMSEPGRSTQVATDGSAAIIAQLGRELEESKKLLSVHKNTLASLTNSLTCQICVDLMHKPYLLTPDGGGNTVPPGLDIPLPGTAEPNPSQTNPLPPRRLDYIRRPKTCPHCRARILSRPVEVYGVKAMVNTLAHSGLVSGFSASPDNDGNVNRSEANTLGDGASSSPNLRTNKDPWAGIFPPVHSVHGGGLLSALADLPFYNGGRWPRPHVTLVNGTTNEGNQSGAPSVPLETLDTHGFHDREDGVYRCVACMHEIWDGVCSNEACGRTYAGHDIDDESDQDHWLGGVDVDDDSESEQGNRIFDDILRAQLGLDDDADEDSLYADFTEDERDLVGPLDGAVAHFGQPPSDAGHPQYRNGYRAGRDNGYNEGYDEGFEEGLVEGRYEGGSRSRVRIPLNDEDEEEDDDDGYEGSFIDDDDDDAGGVVLPLGARLSPWIDESVDIDDDSGSDQVRRSTSSRRNVLVSDEEDEEDDEEDEADIFPITQPGRPRRLAVLPSSDSDS